MKEIKVTKVPACDLCGSITPSPRFDTPVRGTGKWGYLCGTCFVQRGIETEVTTKLVQDG